MKMHDDILTYNNGDPTCEWQASLSLSSLFFSTYTRLYVSLIS